MLPCVILAGGLGTRMRPLTEAIPKALVPVLGVPFVDWQLAHLAEQGVDRVLLCVGHLGDRLRAHVGDGDHLGLTVSYADEGPSLRGTAGALRLAMDGGVLPDEFLLLYGDSYLPVSLRDIVAAWRASRAPALMTVLRNDDRWDASNAVYENGRVVAYDKTRPAATVARMHWIDYGLSVLTRAVIAERVPPGTVSDLADVLRDLAAAGMLAGCEVSERFYEVGSPRGLAELEAHLRATGARPPHGPVLPA